MLNEALGLAGATTWSMVETPLGRVRLRRGFTPHIVAKAGQRRERSANRTIPTLTEPNEVWMTCYDNGEFQMRYVKVWDDHRGGMSIVAE